MIVSRDYKPDPNCQFCHGTGECGGFGQLPSPCVCMEQEQINWTAIQGPEFWREMMNKFNRARSSGQTPHATLDEMGQKISDEFRAALVKLELSDNDAAELLWTNSDMIRRYLRKSTSKNFRVPSAQIFRILYDEIAALDNG